MSRLKTLYISDMDGTLLGSDSRVSPRSAAIISDLTARGAMITVATARTPATVIPLLADVRTTPPAIVMTGAAMWNRSKQRFEHLRFMPGDHVAHVMDLCRHHNIHPFVYVLGDDSRSLDVYHGGSSLSGIERSFYDERAHLKFKRFHLGTPLPPAALKNSMLFFAMGGLKDIEAVAEDLRESTDCSVFCYPDIFNHELGDLEIFGNGVSKAEAVKELRAETGAERVVVFGDNLNDLPMLAAADVAVAVGNAMPEVKNAADIIIEPNYTDAVARFIAADFEGTD